MNYLYDKLVEYSSSGDYPFHMPGHKRQLSMVNPYLIDITEIYGFDDFHDAKSAILNIRKRAERLYSSKESHISVNGSTASNLAAINATTSVKGCLAILGDSHYSAKNAAFLRDLKVVEMPASKTDKSSCGISISKSIDPKEVDLFLSRHPEVETVFITSPTYEGVVSDIESIAKVVHSYNKPLIVDEAHGAHFALSSYFPDSALQKGGDIVINSLHKTLPSMTSTGLMHVGMSAGKYVDIERLEKCFYSYQTTSPSYILMASVDRCLEIVEEEGEELFKAYTSNLEEIHSIKSPHKADLSQIEGIFDYDKSKILLIPETGNGYEFEKILREKYHIIVEKTAEDNCLLMTSICDPKDNFLQLKKVL